MGEKTEFEREPVPESARLGVKSFIGQYAGEHTAGTELMIGPLFVAAGVSAGDLVLGLLIGNLLAVLSWAFMTAPIATRVRLTVYYQLEKICGRKFVVLYNAVNGLAFCFLAGAMITVSATAFGVWFEFAMPGLNDLLPNSVGWVIAVLCVGSVIAIVAAAGYSVVSRFASLAAPWMVLVFIAFGLVGLRDFLDATGSTIASFAGFWALAETTIWKGGDPLPGQVKFTFWHVMFFAWFANMAMHVGMSDLSVFRFARKSRYGFATATGMYLGHFMAWIAAVHSFRLAAASGSEQYCRSARTAGRRCLRYRRTSVRCHCGLDNRKSDHLSGWSRVSGNRSNRVPIQGDIDNRFGVCSCWYVPCGCHEASQFRRPLWVGIDADGRCHFL